MIFARRTTPSPARAARLLGLGAYLPPRTVSNAELSSRLDTTDEWIRTRIGIAERHIADPVTATSDLAAEAGLRAMKSARVEHVDAVVLATATPDHHVPGTAPLVAHRLGLRQIPAFDLGAGCSGFVYATTVAAGLIHAGTAGSVLVIGAEKMSAVIDPADRQTAPIFGDGAGAVVLTAGRADEPGVLGPAAWGSDGEHADAIHIPAGGSRCPSRTVDDAKNQYVHMKGNEVFRHAVRHITRVTQEAAAAAGWRLQDVDRVIVHQANARISAAVAHTLGIPPECLPSNIAHVGNTSAASIPLLLSHSAIDGQLKAGQRVVVTSFGAGFTWAATTLLWPTGLQALV
ncbi:beta-ketoacyl-ACP synthase III [Streptomyces lancefieldiae]|uniref:Beta-ketoacyl-[acyl-carrier-protein] synthase III n=1 Tax=Streptomyces lancefieldiae TaxID=3075520 RepID=A0ABU3AMP6_9ACTN|nr:beta-ketoacyl-ACP synthase III [Streptomyces sp. DSM 40712]MDT0611075.1 beta-ketoacyl-ACP synthase III [Streptomyces sp. DSM 40712]